LIRLLRSDRDFLAYIFLDIAVGETELPPSCCQLNTLAVHPNQVSQLSPAALAYLGDAVYELYVRTSFLFPPKRSHVYHQQVVAQVRAEAQSIHLQVLLPQLTSIELDVIRRGRNAANGRPRRLDPEVYQQATSFETLIGYLYITNPQRLTELLALLQFDPAPAP
jgi:ribonuclease III family protein